MSATVEFLVQSGGAPVPGVEVSLLPIASGPLRLVAFGSNGWTPHAAAIVPDMAAEQPDLVIGGGDYDFAFNGSPPGDFSNACKNFPGLAFYCEGTTPIATTEERQAGYLSMMAPIWLLPRKFKGGNHENEGVSPKGQLQFVYRNPPFNISPTPESVTLSLPGGGLVRIILLPNQPTASDIAFMQTEAAKPATWRIVVCHLQLYSAIKPQPLPWALGEACIAAGIDLYVGAHPVGAERTGLLVRDAAVADGVRAIAFANRYEKGRGTVFVTWGGSGMHPIGTLPFIDRFPVPTRGKAWWRKAAAGPHGGTEYLGATYGLLEITETELRVETRSNGRATVDAFAIGPMTLAQRTAAAVQTLTVKTARGLLAAPAPVKDGLE